MTEQEMREYVELKKKDEERKERYKLYTLRRNVRLSLYEKKCKENGITVTDEEVNDYIRKNKM